ncbi:hypothetical protein ACFE04_018745 [Oxalis oulophora]
MRLSKLCPYVNFQSPSAFRGMLEATNSLACLGIKVKLIVYSKMGFEISIEGTEHYPEFETCGEEDGKTISHWLFNLSSSRLLFEASLRSTLVMIFGNKISTRCMIVCTDGDLQALFVFDEYTGVAPRLTTSTTSPLAVCFPWMTKR